MTILRSPSLRLIVLLFQAAWLNIVVPGHQRGIVALPGDDRTACHFEDAGCCPEMAGAVPSRPKAPARGDPSSHCAICHFAAALFAAPPVDLSHPALEFLETVDPLPPDQAKPFLFPSPYYGRAPPVHSFQSA